MSTDKKTHRTFTEHELLDYLDGKIKGEKANELERYLMSSEFDAEAMEGLTSQDIPLLQKDLNSLRAAIERKTEKKEFNWYSLAATLSFLLISMAAIWFVVDKALPNDRITILNDSTVRNTESMSVAAVEDSAKENKADEVPPMAGLAMNVDSTRISAPLLAESLKEDSSAGEEIPEPEENVLAFSADVNTDFSDENAENSDYSKSIAQQTFSESEKSLKKESTETFNAVGASRTAVPIKTPAEPMVKGTVYFRDDGEPLAGVNVKAGNAKTVTGLDGKFQLKGVDSLDQIQFSFVGMNDKVVSSTNAEPLTVILEADASSLDEVVIIGYGGVNKASGIKSPEPVNGRTAYNTYLKNSLRYPPNAQQNQIGGEVLLKVTISSEGTLHNIEVKKSLGYGCDEEAMRLVREGPGWKPGLYNGEPIEAAVRVRVKFLLK